MKKLIYVVTFFYVCQIFAQNTYLNQVLLLNEGCYDYDQEVILEPVGGAHRDKDLMLENVGQSLKKNLNFFQNMEEEEILSHRKKGIHRTLSLAYNESSFDYLIKNIDSFRHRRFGRQGHVDKFYSRCKIIVF